MFPALMLLEESVLCNRDVVYFLCGMNCIFIYYVEETALVDKC
jgi:hypothetical protein